MKSKLAKEQGESQETTGKNNVATRTLSKTRGSWPFSASHRKSTVIGVIFLVAGIAALLVSIFLTSQTVALVGLGLSFWGALFILIAPSHYVKGTLLVSSAISTYLTIDRIIGDYKYHGQAYYIPPYSQEGYLPEHLKGLRETVAFVSAKKEATMPAIEEIAASKFMLSNKKGVLIAAPGLGLLAEAYKRMKRTPKMDISDLCETFPKIMMGDFALAKEIVMHAETEKVKLIIRDSLYMDLYAPESDLKSISILGCPLASAIACSIANNTGKSVTIQETKVSPEDLTVEIEYRFV